MKNDPDPFYTEDDILPVGILVLIVVLFIALFA